MSKQLQERARQAELIVLTPSEYKICEGCGSIVRSVASICPVCKSYRFDEDQSRVVAHAKELGSREAQTLTEEEWNG